jgi:sterol desaturase/sphingolipid hydroxylase (fatty acid hydroxylase superfamily)/uncharacterized membrane protein YhhN
MTPSQIIVLATPVFFVLIALEFAWGYARQRKATGHNTYRLSDAINSISLGMLSQLSAVFTRVLRVGIYTAVFSTVALYPHLEFWNTWYGWVLALLFYDFCYYWLHRAGHECALFWAAHVVHHQSQDYNLSTALRQTSSGALVGWVFYVPMAIAGVPPAIFAVVALIDLLYQFWVHTEHVPKLGWFDRVFCSPSNHRVHHAVNDHYLDKNYGGLLILWDRMFGSFREEDEKCVYGTRSPLQSWDPLWANTEVYWALLKDSWHAKSWADKFRIWFKPPGWRPAELAQRFPKPAFELAAVKTYNPPASRGVMGFAALQFVVLLGGVSVFLWESHNMNGTQSAIWVGGLSLGLWAVGAVLQGRLSMLEVLFLEAAMLATATSSLGQLELYALFKPMALSIAIVFVAYRAYQKRAGAEFLSFFDKLLLAALLASLAGDVFLLYPGQFIPGLASFLVAHLFFLALFRQGVGWFPSQRALLLTLGAGCAMYVFLWSGLTTPLLKVACGVYMVAIALMTAQAIGRATVLRDKASVGVAVGACFFMLSDSLLATHRFMLPLPLASLWVLGTYYTAQLLLVHHARPPQARG